ncbi:MAG: glycosyltransferase [Anaerolineaceae bacterium]
MKIGFNKERMQFIPNGFDLSEFRFKLLMGLDRSLVSSRVVSLTTSGIVGGKIADLGIQVQTLNMEAGRLDPIAVFRLAKLLKSAGSELVQTWMYHADLIGGSAAFLSGGIPTLWNIRNSTLDRETSKKSTRMVVGINACLSHWLPKRILVCSENARFVHKNLGYAGEKMQLVPNGFNLNEFHPDSSARKWLLQELNLADDIHLIGLVARFDPQKDIHSFIMAAKTVHAKLPNIHFILCGDRMGPENQELTDWLDNEELRDKFHLLGRRDDMPRVTAGFDLAVSSSAYGEAFSNVIGEAMACGIPCVATDVGDSAAIIADTGLIVPPRDPQKLADAIINLMRRPDSERETLGSAARERIQSNYDLKAVIEAYTRIYQEVFNE